LLPIAAALAVPGDEVTAWGRFEDLGVEYLRPLLAKAESLSLDWDVSSWKPALDAIVSAYRVDPALADRRAREFADGNVYGAREAAALAELFFRLGDPGRAHAWTEALVLMAPELPGSQIAAGLGNALVGDVDRADLFFTAAAAASGDAGAVWALAANAYRRMGQSLAAVDAGRRAVGLTAYGWDMRVLLDVGWSQKALGRLEQASATFDALWLRFASEDRASAKKLVQAVSSDPGVSRLDTLLGPIRVELGFPGSTAK